MATKKSIPERHLKNINKNDNTTLRTKSQAESSHSRNSNDSFFVKPPKVSAIQFKVGKGENADNPILKKKHQKSKTNNVSVASTNVAKKSFDKKAWRLKKYSKKYKLQQWEARRKHAIVHGYHKTIKQNGPNTFNVAKIYEEQANDWDEDQETSEPHLLTNKGADTTDCVLENLSKVKSKPFTKAQLNYKRLTDEKEERRAETLKKKAIKDEALKAYKKKKMERFKKLNRKTKRGQPVMKDRIEILLEDIQNSLKN